MQPIRCHFTAIFENVLKFFWQLLPAFILPIVSAGQLASKGLVFLLAIPACFLVALLIQFLVWRQTWLSADAEQLQISSGLIWKKHQSIPFKKINTVDLSRNLFQRIFGTCRIKIDTGAVTGGSKTGSEVNLVFTLPQAEAIRSQVLSLASGVASLHDDYLETAAAPDPAAAANPGPAAAAATQPGGYIHADYPAAGSQAAGHQEPRIRPVDPGKTVQARTVDFFLYGLTQNKLLGGLVLIFSIFTFAGEIFGEQIGGWAGKNLEIAWNQVSQWYIVLTVLIALGLFLLFYAIASLTSIVYAIVRFYHFKASREGDNIHIEYGLLTVKSYTLPIKNIHAVIISQNLYRQWLKQCSVEVVSIGYGDEKNEVALLFPLIRLDRLEELIGRILPEYQGQMELKPAPQAALFRYLLLPVLTLLLFCGSLAFVWPPILLALIPLLPLLVLDRWLNYHNAGINYSADRIEVRNGGFNRRRYRVRLDAVQSVSSHSNPMLERAGLQTYRIDYHAPALRATILVRYLSPVHWQELCQLLELADAVPVDDR